MGERNPATAAPIAPGVSVKPMYLGRKVRGVRRHHAWRRPRLQEKRAFRVIKAQRNRESPRGVRSSPRPSTDWWPWRGRTAPPSRSGNSREAAGTRGRGGGSPVRELDAVCADPWDGAGQGRVGGRPRGVGGRGPHQSVVPSMPEPREARPTGRVPVPLGNVGVAWKCRHVQRSQHRQPSGETGGPGGPRWGRLDTAHEPGGMMLADSGPNGNPTIEIVGACQADRSGTIARSRRGTITSYRGTESKWLPGKFSKSTATPPRRAAPAKMRAPTSRPYSSAAPPST